MGSELSSEEFKKPIRQRTVTFFLKQIAPYLNQEYL
jgi:hypothetical protein